MTGNIFDEINKDNADYAQASRQHENDMREAMRMLMTRQEGRVFVRKILETTTDISHLRDMALMVMSYTEATHA